MFKNLIIVFALLLSPFCENIFLNSNNFCKQADSGCSKNSLNIYQCERSICAKKESDFKEFMIVNEQIKVRGLVEFIEVLSGFAPNRHSNSQLKERFKQFKSKIKNCSQTRYEWEPSDVCIRKRNCLKVNLVKSDAFIQTRKDSCPCPANKAYICGNQSNFCSLNREACESFSYTYKNKNSTARFQLLALNKCV